MEYFTYKDTRVELKYFVTFTQLLDFTDYQSLFEKRERYEKKQRSLFLCINTLGFESNLDSYLFHFEE